MVRIETVLLADQVRTEDNQMLIRGLGVPIKAVPRYPAQLRFPLVFVVTVSWADAGQPFAIQMRICTADGQPLGEPHALGAGTVVLNPHTPKGAEMTTVMAADVVVHIPAPGTYRLVVQTAGGESSAIRDFHCIVLPAIPTT